jgi:hypothetical protein
LPENTCKQKGLFDTLWAMNGNETPLAPLVGNNENGTFTGSSPAPRTIFRLSKLIFLVLEQHIERRQSLLGSKTISGCSSAISRI